MTNIKHRIWESPNGRFTIFALLLPNERVPSIKIKVKGRKTLIDFNNIENEDKFPKYIQRIAKIIRWDMTRDKVILS